MVSTSWRKTPHPFTTDLDISSDEFWRKSFDEREKTFAQLRKTAPVSWHPTREAPDIPDELHGEMGFWAVVKNKDIEFVSQNQELFSSDAIKWGSPFLRPVDPRFYGAANMLEMDPPDHTRFRRIMSAAFTPKGVARVSEKINERAEQIVDRVVGLGSFDFVKEVSGKLPMLTVADLVGLPESMVQPFADAGENFVAVAFGGADADTMPDGVNPLGFIAQQLAIVREIGVDIVNYRREHPAADIATALAQAEIDGRKLSDDDVEATMILLSVAGNDTTKQTTSHVAAMLDKNPDQKAQLTENFDGRIAGAVDEFVRHASPAVQFARTATQDVEFNGQQIMQGDKVVMFYCSGNRDENVFNDPARFDINRERNGHVAFGGGGVHYCLGHGVAKAQLRAIFGRLLITVPDLEITGEPEPFFSDFVNGIKHLPARA